MTGKNRDRSIFFKAAFLAGILAGGGLVFSAETDLLGDPLPEEAVTRVGSVRPEEKLPEDFARPFSLRGAAISANGRVLATYGEPANPKAGRPIHIWDGRTGKPLRELEGHEWPIRAIAMSPGGKTLVSSSFDVGQGTGVTRIWDVATGETRHVIPEGGDFLRFEPGGRSFWLVVRETLRVYNAGTGREIRRFLGPNLTLDISADGRFVLGISHKRDEVLRMYDTNTQEEVLKLEGTEGPPKLARFSPDGRTIAALDRSDNVRIWEVATGRLVHQLIGHKGRVFALTFSPDGRFLVSGGLDQTLRVWELATGNEVDRLAGHKGIVTVLKFTKQSNRLISGSTDRTALLWNTSNSLVSRLKIPAFQENELTNLWNDLAAGTPSKAYLALGTALAEEETALPFLLRQLEGLLVPSKNNRIEKLIQELDDDDFRVRHLATVELRKLRKVAQPLLLKVLKETDSAEVRARLRYILNGANTDSRFSSSDKLRMRRLIQLAEQSGTSEAKSLLEVLRDECPLPEIVQEAERALQRLKTP